MRMRLQNPEPQPAGIRAVATALLITIIMALPLPALAQDDAPTVLITGSNASHGLAFAEEYAALGWNVIATCRTPAKADRLNALAEKYPNVVVEELDIVDVAEIDALVEKYKGKPIDVLLNNAAINAFRFGPNFFGKIDYEWFEADSEGQHHRSGSGVRSFPG